MCAAFQVTAADRADAVAIRTKGDEFSITWGEYADKVKRLASGLAGLGLERGKTIGVDPDAHGDLAATFEGHALDAGECRQLRLQRAQQPIRDGRHAALRRSKAEIE